MIRKLRIWLLKWKYEECWRFQVSDNDLFSCKCGGDPRTNDIFCRECPYFTNPIK